MRTLVEVDVVKLKSLKGVLDRLENVLQKFTVNKG